MPTKEAREEMLAKYVAQLSDSAQRKGQLEDDIRRFLDFVGYHELNRENINKYIEHLRTSGGWEGAGLSAGTIKNKWGAIHRFFVVNNLEWPFKRQDTPDVPEGGRNAPAIHPLVIKMYIDAAKAGKMSPRAVALLALSTTYGLRPDELQKVKLSDIDFNSKAILIHTSKKGRERWQKIPDEIVPYLKGYDYEKRSYHWVRKAWFEVEAAAGREHIPDSSFKSIRRTLITEITKRCKEGVVHRFMRWADVNIQQRYVAAHYVGLEAGEEHNVGGEDMDTDTEVFKIHPFVKLWR